MSCDRPDRRARDRVGVVDELRLFAGIQFDPRVVQEFLLILETRGNIIAVLSTRDLGQ